MFAGATVGKGARDRYMGGCFTVMVVVGRFGGERKAGGRGLDMFVLR